MKSTAIINRTVTHNSDVAAGDEEVWTHQNIGKQEQKKKNFFFLPFFFSFTWLDEKSRL